MSPKLVKRPICLTRHKPVIIHALPMTITLSVSWFICSCILFVFRLVCRRIEAMSPKLVKRPVYPTCCNHALPMRITLLGSVGWFISSCILFVFWLVCRRIEGMSPKLVKRPVYLTCCDHNLPVTITLLYLLVGLFVTVFYLCFHSSVVGYRQCRQN